MSHERHIDLTMRVLWNVPVVVQADAAVGAVVHARPRAPVERKLHSQVSKLDVAPRAPNKKQERADGAGNQPHRNEYQERRQLSRTSGDKRRHRQDEPHRQSEGEQSPDPALQVVTNGHSSASYRLASVEATP